MNLDERQSDRLPSLDGMRAFAVAWVVVGHSAQAPGMAGTAWAYGMNKLFSAVVGVQVFFTISGFLITRLLLQERARHGRVALKPFYQRRALRLLPAAVVYLLVVAALGPLMGWGLSTQEFLGALFFFRNQVQGGHWQTGHFWSLSVEEQFYLLWPWVLACWPLVSTRLLWCAVALAPLARGWGIHQGSPDWLFWWVSNFDTLGMGALLAVHQQRFQTWERALPDGRRTLLRLLAVVMFFAVALLPYGWLHVSGWAHGTVVAASAAYLISSLTATHHGALYRACNHPAALALGMASYSIYLWQQLFLGAQRVLPGGLPVALLGLAAAAWASWHCLERPFMPLRSRLRV